MEITGDKNPRNRKKTEPDAQGDHLSRVDLGVRCRWLRFLADSTARCRALWRQHLRNDLAMARSGLCQQSVLARSLELERSTSGASEMLPGTVATRFRAGRGLENFCYQPVKNERNPMGGAKRCPLCFAKSMMGFAKCSTHPTC
jgi:hypothetical protein